ncbi:MAG: radical SAM family heme chaperone HemW [Deinococcales bacterium]
MVRALYLHVPFCPSVCPYCDFHKMLRNEGLVARYLDRLEREAEARAERYPGPLDTIYFGGGTPSHLRDDELERLVGVLARTFGFPGRLETTLEADPLTFTPERLRRFAGLGFDRLSIGLQSTQDAVLRFLGRVHDGRQGMQALRWALDSGLRVNADVITAVPGQDAERDLRTVAASGVRHMSVYSLTVEPGTPFALRGVQVDPDREADAYEATAPLLAEYGLERYEVSNYAVPGEESRHNQGTWRGAPYLGLGPSASSYLPEGGPFGTRLRNPPIRAWLEGAAPERDALDARGVLLERLLTGLRTREGVDVATLRRDTGLALEDAAPRWLADALGHGLLTREGPRVRATDDGLARLDALLRAFVRAT